MTTDNWQPLSLQETGRLLRGLDGPWWIAGGWALDLFLGRISRAHNDVDVALLRGDQPKLQALLTGWDVQVAQDGLLTPWSRGDWLEPPRFQFWARRSAEAPWSLEFLLENCRDGVWLYRRNPAVSMPLPTIGRISQEGLPYLCPEIALLYKATSPEVERNRLDFERAGPALEPAARTWLRDALLQAHPGHSWLSRL